MITLATLASHSAQEVFDYAVTFLLTQNERSVDSYGDCKYRSISKEGKALKCGGGCFISDEEYNLQLESNTWTGLLETSRVPEAHYRLIKRFQSIHDGYPVSQWREGFTGLAEQAELSSAVVEEFVD